MKQYFVYILGSHSNEPVLYVGVTINLENRLYEHKNRLLPGFTSEYRCDKLVYFEITMSIESAILREKQLKNWRRQWKLDLIRENNPSLVDLSREIGQEIPDQVRDDSSGGSGHLMIREEEQAHDGVKRVVR